jgi:hypothetical protein
VFEDPGENEAELTISVSDNKITVTLATDENGNIISTAADIADAINSDEGANALVTASVGTEAVSIGSATSVTVTLSGGNDEASATPAIGVLKGVTFTAATPGAAGNNIEIVFEDPGASEAGLSISVDGNKITVTLATDENGNIKSTVAGNC